MSNHDGDGVSNRRRKRRRDMPPPEHTATLAELNAWLTTHSARHPDTDHEQRRRQHR